MTALATLDEPIENLIPYSSTRDNFYAAAKLGLRSSQRWIDGKDINARDLILEKLLPLAHQGLTTLGISIEDSDKYLGIIHERVMSGQNGSTWQRLFIKKHGHNMTELTRAYIKNQNSGEPVHRWHHQKLGEQACSLTVLDELPEGILKANATELHHHLSGPTLIRLQGERKDVLFVSVLLHGNETTGWDAVREVLLQHEQNTLPRGLYLFIGNVAAAAEGVRLLDGQQDFNRIWKKNNKTAEGKMAAELLEILASVSLFAAVDVHNNTGINPHYACINELDKRFFHLATLFSRTVVYFRRPDSVLSLALSKMCPATTVECGKARDSRGKDHAKEFLHACLHLQAFPGHDVAEHDIDVFHTVATVKVAEDLDFGIEKPGAKINFIGNMDRLNFQELSAGTVLAHINCGKQPCLHAYNEDGDDVVEEYFSCDKGLLRFSVPLMPSMLTLDEQIIRQDCLCYLMERLDYHKLKQEQAVSD